ncbi:hypothetical protein D3C78_1376700 [compost metagenome]
MITRVFNCGDQRLGSGVTVNLGAVDTDVGGNHPRHRFQRFAGAGSAVHAAQTVQLQLGIRLLRHGGLIAGSDYAVNQRLARRLASDFGIVDIDLCLFDIFAAFQGFFHPLRAVHAGQPLQCQHCGL